MADLATSAVANDVNVSSMALSNGLTVFRRQLTLTLTGQGTTTNRILASVLGFSTVQWVSNFVKTDNTEIIPAVPSSDRSMILLMDPKQATDANRALPADFTGTYKCTVEGY